MYGAVQGLRSNGNTSDVYALVAGIFAALFAGCLIFWAWFALAVIGEGDAYNCIGGCNSYTLYNNATNNAFNLFSWLVKPKQSCKTVRGPLFSWLVKQKQRSKTVPGSSTSATATARGIWG